ncbi:MAG: hypothetical protein CO128_00720 [Ignavibacteriales bacterium CG_4_9_14_3_um_filter_30_11]|nr:MAG: hypothetical protein CO128_00720 [Ignavibacteriales bacterium CG_4_9_14_3_um_filter_30_11]
MKKLFCFFPVLLFVILFSSKNNAQVTNLKVNGSSSPFTMTSGDNLSWSYNLSSGGTSIFEVWVDVNSNNTIDQSTDIRMFLFTITDGVSEGIDGPGDMDGTVNGAISDGPFGLGLAPGKYIMKITENSVGQTITGTVNSLSSPSYTISGKVTPPTGFSASNIIVEMDRDDITGVMLWNSITDVNGNYTINMSSDTTGPWTLQISSTQNPFPSSIITPQEYIIYITTSLTGKDFVVTKADAKVSGTLKFENNSPAIGSSLTLFDLNSNNQNGTFRHDGTVGIDGSFQIGVPLSELNGQRWVLESDLHQSDTTESYMDARVEISSINQNDSLYYDLIFYEVDTTITGKVSFQNQTVFPSKSNNTNLSFITLIALTSTAQSAVHNNTSTGDFTLRVSSKLPSYDVFGIDLPTGYDPITIHNVAPGATNVNLSFILTDVKERTSGIPESYSLSQNYPNPFNPTTNINYDIPNESFVNITVYNDLGQEVMTLVNKEQKAGKYVVSFNAKVLSSGIYFYQIKANDFVQIKKMILLK